MHGAIANRHMRALHAAAKHMLVDKILLLFFWGGVVRPLDWLCKRCGEHMSTGCAVPLTDISQKFGGLHEDNGVQGREHGLHYHKNRNTQWSCMMAGGVQPGN